MKLEAHSYKFILIFLFDKFKEISFTSFFDICTSSRKKKKKFALSARLEIQLRR